MLQIAMPAQTKEHQPISLHVHALDSEDNARAAGEQAFGPRPRENHAVVWPMAHNRSLADWF
jgi:hypothetical protein